MKRIVFFAALLVISGCATTAQKLIDRSKNTNTIETNQNYQALYRDVLTVARDCLAGPINLAVSNKVEGQLYNDLNFGEINFYQDNLSPMYLVYAKISKAGDGSKAEIYASGSGYLEAFEAYVRGKKSC
jgi:hypothetical protein